MFHFVLPECLTFISELLKLSLYSLSGRIVLKYRQEKAGGKKMQIIHSIQLHSGSNEENLPGFTPEFPYIASRAELDHYREFFVPWHWHKAVELFYMESGEIRYHTPGGTEVFPAGTGGMVNSNVLHMTEMLSRTEENVQYLHIFDPVLIAGAYGNLIEKKYVTPLAAASQLELIRLTPDIPEQAEILTMIRQAFRLDENEFGCRWRAGCLQKPANP